MKEKIFLFGIVVLIGLYLIYKTRKSYLLKKYPPGSGKKLLMLEYSKDYLNPRGYRYWRREEDHQDHLRRIHFVYEVW